ncbi:benzoate/H(+) symporter BenE family transporter [Acidisoma cellulosilytica]|uniref:Benzoate/H(+) symporter BenE family transporter n=1 Tax=Acidisoma cellulosilyticum TaxID=2802395 RepID=A0A964E387_9PROT|nr:benzoate/H(+) symporter BenE family transporter [Acidisoma cellulosilyticum]MCB8880440.1 benzoate/H(+) symporter BenE family transporter [Acidisoma cellulosilyticum]
MAIESLWTAIRRDSSWQAASSGSLAAFVGFGSSFAVILHGVAAAGASPVQAASGLFALLVVTGLFSILVSVKLRMPIIVAWTTPGAALLVSTPAPHGGFAYTVGAFFVCGLLIMMTGFWPVMSRIVGAIPRSLASAMLGGIVFELCLAPILGLRDKPLFIVLILLVWVVVGRIRRTLAVPAAVVVAVGLAALDLHDASAISLHLPLAWVTPRFSLSVAISVAVPLFVVTMAGQNIPGFAVLNINGYRPRHGFLLGATGLASMLVAPFGGIPINLAAITAAMCASPEAHTDADRRWWASAVAGFVYMAIGLFSGLITTFIALSSPVLITAVAGIALFGALASSLAGAVAEPAERDAAMVTFLMAASGLQIFGIGGAFWGLLAGGAVLTLQRVRSKMS